MSSLYTQVIQVHDKPPECIFISFDRGPGLHYTAVPNVHKILFLLIQVLLTLHTTNSILKSVNFQYPHITTTANPIYLQVIFHQSAPFHRICLLLSWYSTENRVLSQLSLDWVKARCQGLVRRSRITDLDKSEWGKGI